MKLDELDTLKLEHEAMDRMKRRDTEEAHRIDLLKVVRLVHLFSVDPQLFF